MTETSGIVDASGGGMTPYIMSPGRTRSYHTRESRSVAALLAACRIRGVDAQLGQAREHLLESLALRVKQRRIRIVGRREMRVDGDDLQIAAGDQLGQRELEVVVPQPEPVHARVDLQMTAKPRRHVSPPRLAATGRRRGSRWSASGCGRTRRRPRSRRARRRSESRSVTPAFRSTTASSMSAHARIFAPASCSASATAGAPWPYALALTTAMMPGVGEPALFERNSEMARKFDWSAPISTWANVQRVDISQLARGPTPARSRPASATLRRGSPKLGIDHCAGRRRRLRSGS